MCARAAVDTNLTACQQAPIRRDTVVVVEETVLDTGEVFHAFNSVEEANRAASLDSSLLMFDRVDCESFHSNDEDVAAVAATAEPAVLVQKVSAVINDDDDNSLKCVHCERFYQTRESMRVHAYRCTKSSKKPTGKRKRN